MVAFFLVLALGAYLVLMFGLTFWFERYHYYKHRFYSTPQSTAATTNSEQGEQETDTVPDPESNHRQIIKSEVCERE